jgi:outer membrane receptor for Fe3+-dicitrate
MLEGARVFNVSEALRKASGVHVRDEEGFGLRPNIGIRGLNPTRSAKVLLLEDGLPLAYAPYGDNVSYYHPPIERFESAEILKGSGQIAYGPVTVGGVVNHVTPGPPAKSSAKPPSERRQPGLPQPACGGMANLNTTCGNEGRLRDYDHFGIEPCLRFGHRLFGVSSEAEAGVRAHFGVQERIQENGDTPTACSGLVVEDNRRENQAYSAFLHLERHAEPGDPDPAQHGVRDGEEPLRPALPRRSGAGSPSGPAAAAAGGHPGALLEGQATEARQRCRRHPAGASIAGSSESRRDVPRHVA